MIVEERRNGMDLQLAGKIVLVTRESKGLGRSVALV